jgi:hypothetical protein
MNFKVNDIKRDQTWWYTSVIPATQEAWVGEPQSRVAPGKKIK